MGPAVLLIRFALWPLPSRCCRATFPKGNPLSSCPVSSSVTALPCHLPKGEGFGDFANAVCTKTFPLGGRCPEGAEEGEREWTLPQNGAPAEPNEVGLLGRGGARKRREGDRREPEREWTLPQNGAPAEPNEVGLLGRGGARKRREGDRREPEREWTLRRRGTNLRQIWDKSGTKTG